MLTQNYNIDEYKKLCDTVGWCLTVNNFHKFFRDIYQYERIFNMPYSDTSEKEIQIIKYLKDEYSKYCYKIYRSIYKALIDNKFIKTNIDKLQYKLK